MGWENLKGIIVVPLTLAVLAIIVLSFSASADHAVQFFGSFTAAIVAAMAVILTTYLQAHFARQDKAAERKAEATAEAVELYIWLNNLAMEFNYAALVIDRWLQIQPVPQITVKNLRSNLSADVRTRLRNRLIIASRLPKPFNLTITDTLHKADAALDVVCYAPMLGDDIVCPMQNLRDRHRAAVFQTDMIFWHRAALGKFLVDDGAIQAIDIRDREAIGKGIPTAPLFQTA